MRLLHLLPLFFALLAVVVSPARAQQDLSLYGEQELRRGWSLLSLKEKREASQYFSAEVQKHDSLQRRLIQLVTKAARQDPGLWPRARELRFYAPETHTPNVAPIKRRRLDPRGSKALAAIKRYAAPADPQLAPAYVYDWGERTVHTVAVDDDHERVFHNALLGAPPDLDLALALVLRSLDDGREQELLAAFDHAYTDRSGNVYPFTLYRAWSSGQTLEMPDVDCLGIVHDVLKDWNRWTAPVPALQHKQLYAAIGDLYLQARRYRGLREAVAATFLRAAPDLPEGYAAIVTRLHTLWSYHHEHLGRMAGALPGADKVEEFQSAWAETVSQTPELLSRGQTRQHELAVGEQIVQGVLGKVLKELGAFGRSLPADAGGKSKSATGS